MIAQNRIRLIAWLAYHKQLPEGAVCVWFGLNVLDVLSGEVICPMIFLKLNFILTKIFYSKRFLHKFT